MILQKIWNDDENKLTWLCFDNDIRKIFEKYMSKSCSEKYVKKYNSKDENCIWIEYS